MHIEIKIIQVFFTLILFIEMFNLGCKCGKIDEIEGGKYEFFWKILFG